MKKRTLVAAGFIAVLVLAGCQSTANNTETEELKRQVAELEQQVTALEQGNASETTSEEAVPEQPAANETTAGVEQPEAAQETPTIKELTDKVNAYLEKVKAAIPSADENEKMEQFFELKKEEETLERELDRYEDDLEVQYRNGSLNREDYRTLEREAERLEEQLDDAEDTLERTFKMDA